MIIKNVRADWLFIFEKNKQDKYGICAILPKGSDQEKQVRKAIDLAKERGVADGKFTVANTKSASFKHCLRDGDKEIETEDRPKHYKNSMFFNASNTTQPGALDKHLDPIMDQDMLYSGCYCHIDVNFYPYNHPKGGKGIGAGLNHIMFVKDGDRLDGRQSAEEVFAGLEVEAPDELT